MTRTQALEILRQFVKQDNMIKHSLASEAVMRALAVKLNQDTDKWALAGLLHDLDVEITSANALIHGQKTVEILTQLGVDIDVIDAISMHNECSAKAERYTIFHHALAAGETITGLITATTLVYPEKKLASVKTKSVVKRMKEKNFAASVKRENIMECELIGIPITEFAEIAITAMNSISDELGL
ncbi:MAG: HDIG domain-containing protein [Bacteroidetes bacterium]|nr:HDIG domain-containing protein [Bacteroidota bacterium]